MQPMKSNLAVNDKSKIEIKNVIVIASYLEALALPIFLESLSCELTEETLVIIADDSPDDYFADLEISVNQQFAATGFKVLWSHKSEKSGRGAAVKRGMELAFVCAPKFRRLIECDADGSHTSHDIAKIIAIEGEIGAVIGSRYIKGSAIVGWSLGRRFFSRLINLVLPYILGVYSHDVTNGLRMYSREAVELISSKEITCPGFIYLSEQLLICMNNEIQIIEVPVTFVNRTLGKSTVTKKELTDSLLGIVKLWKMRRQH